jgi:rhodanese-related sulfurtransferase
MRQISPKELQELQQQEENFLLLDVRETFEHAICNLGGKLIPLAELPVRYRDLDKNQHIIVYCKHGVRGMRAAEFLVTQGFTHVSNLSGGIIAWIETIDPSLPQY